MANQIKETSDTAIAELRRRLDGYDKLHAFVTELATWEATTDSWYGLFKSYQRQASDVLKEINHG